METCLNMTYREEKDFLGREDIPANALWGIHTLRAVQNFNLSGYKIHKEFIKAYGLVKLACALINKEIGYLPSEKADFIIQACRELSEGSLYEHVIVDPLQGGAGTSLNMNINEVIANRSLELADKYKGDYRFIDPIEHINAHQSTNDTYPTALKIACIFMFRNLEKELTALQESFQEKEKEFADIVKIGRTQLMDAVLTTLGKEFSAYAEAVSRDRWRVYKCEERLRTVNLGGTAIGTGVCAPRKFIFGATEKLRELTGIGLARAENMVENTQNLDIFSETSGILKAHAVNLIKISNDLRLMNSGQSAGFGEITLPAVQAGSSIMPGKVNPVIPEMASQAGLKVLGNDSVINHCAAMGQLELNQNLPLIAFCMLESLEILINTNKILRIKCINGITANRERISLHVENSMATLTAFVSELGYNKVAQISKDIEELNRSGGQKVSVKDYLVKNGFVDEKRYDELTSPSHNYF